MTVSSTEDLWPKTPYTQLSIKAENEAAALVTKKVESAHKEQKPGCSKCQQEKQPKKSKGLGDTIAKITSRLGIKQCSACKKRQKALNKRFKYGKDS